MPIINQVTSGSVYNASVIDAGTSATTANAVWVIWNGVYTDSTTAVTTLASDMTTSTSTIWTVWNQSYCTSASTTVAVSSCDVWNAWNHQIRAVAVVPPAARAIRQRPTEAEVQAQLRREQQWREEEDKRIRERKAADDKAEMLLMAHLNPQQREDLIKRSAFIVEAHGHRYEIRRGRSGNVRLLKASGQTQRTFCVHPSISCPDADTMLAQKLLIEHDLRKFYELANVTEYEDNNKWRNFQSPTGLQLLEQMKLAERVCQECSMEKSRVPAHA